MLFHGVLSRLIALDCQTEQCSLFFSSSVKNPNTVHCLTFFDERFVPWLVIFFLLCSVKARVTMSQRDNVLYPRILAV